MDFVRLFQNIHDPLALKKESDEIEKLKQIIIEKDTIIENNEEKIKELERSSYLENGKEIDDKTETNNDMYSILIKYEKLISSTLHTYETEKHEKKLAQNHLARLETAFHDLIQKYERAKDIINGFQENETALLKHIEEFENNLDMLNDKYTVFKCYALNQIKEANDTIELKEKEHTKEIKQLKDDLDIANKRIKYLEEEASKKDKSYSIFQPLVTNFK